MQAVFTNVLLNRACPAIRSDVRQGTYEAVTDLLQLLVAAGQIHLA
jgi:hypothetical protein